MELITIILSGLFTLVSPVGIVADRLAEGLIRDRVVQAEQIDVRIDNAPSFQLLGGRVDRVRIAGRGVYPVEQLRIDILDVETDPIDLDLGAVSRGRLALDEPVQSATRLVLRVDDLNTFLQSRRVQRQLNRLQFSLPGGGAREANRYGLSNPRLEILDGNRVRIQVNLEDRVLNEQIDTVVETGLDVVDGHQLVLLDPRITVDEQAVPQELLNAFVEGIREQLTLKQLEADSVVARVLRFQLTPEEIDLALFVRVNPDSSLLGDR